MKIFTHWWVWLVIAGVLILLASYQSQIGNTGGQTKGVLGST
jgi:hypothetical protein